MRTRPLREKTSAGRTHGEVLLGIRGPFASDKAMEALVGQAGFRHMHTVTTVVKARFNDPEHWYR